MTTGSIDFEALFGDSDAPTFWLDRDGRVGWLNAAARAVVAATHGREAEVGDSMFDLAVPSTRADFEANFAEALAGRATTRRRWIDYPSGLSFTWEIRYVPTRDRDDRVTGVIFTASNRTFATEAAVRLRNVERALELASMPLAIVRKVEARRADVVFANRTLAGLLARSVDELVGADWTLDFDDVTRGAIGDAIEHERGLRVALRDPRDTAEWLRLRIEPLPKEPAEVAHFVVTRDAVELPSTAIAASVAREVERESVLADVAAATAHDVANLVTVVAMSADALDPGSDFGAAFHELAERAVVKLRRLGRATRSNAPIFEVRKVLRALEPLLTHALEGRAELVVDPRLDEAIVAFPRASFERIVLGLVANARRAMGDSIGCVTLRARVEPDRVCVLVSDDGPLAPSIRASAIDRTTSDGTTSSTLLSLHAAVHELRAFGGELAMVSGPVGGDVRFELSLPRAVLDAAPTVAPRGGDETIWLVEREPLLARTTTRALESLGYRVLVTTSTAESPTAPVDLAIADLFAGAIDLLRGSALPGAPLVMTSAELFEAPTFESASRPVVFLRKPYSTAELDAAIRRALAMRG